jgi:hypothetical protein
MEGMKTPSPDAQLLADIRARLPHTENHVDRALLLRCITTLSRLTPFAVSPPPTSPTTTAETVAHRISADPSVLAAIHLATDGLGPYFRLVAASKSVDCPRCHSPAEVRCIGERLCDERTWAYAAQRRWDRANLTPENVAVIRGHLKERAEHALHAAIRVGIVRLERTPDDAGVQWVDAV